MKNTKLLLQALNYEFNDKQLLVQALTHRSYSGTNNERLEFLGDSVLNFVVADLLYETFPKLDEGDLSRVRAHLVKQASLADIANKLKLSDYLRLGEGELKSGGFRRPSILSDALEAIFGAIFLDSGFNTAQQVIRQQYMEVISNIDPLTLGKDPKTLLQEMLQAHKFSLPNYLVVNTHGAAHDQLFDIECRLDELDIVTTASGSSRRDAEQKAAQLALEAVSKYPLGKAKKRKPSTVSKGKK